MKKIILSILMLCGLLIASEQDVNKLNQQYASTVEYNNKLVEDTKLIYEKIKNDAVNVEKKFDSSSSLLSYIIDGDKNVSVKLNFNLTGFDNMTIKEMKELIANIKNEEGVNKILLDLEASTVNDFKENLLLKKELEFEKKKNQELSNTKDEVLKKIKDIQDEIKKSGLTVLFIVFALGVVLTLYVQLEIDFFKRDKENLPLSKYILNYGVKLFILVCLIIFAIQSFK